MTSMRPFFGGPLCRPPSANKGAALLVMLFLILAAFSTIFVAQLSKANLETQRQQKTAEALAQAKEALIGYAVSVTSNSARPGDLPCPDRDNDGKAGTTIPLDSSCGNAAGGNQIRRLGRLPWKDLGLDDLRDSSGERLWYAVSNNFKESSRKPNLNSDTIGTITVRSSNGTIVYDGSAGNGVVAVIIAPGPPIVRQDGWVQDRSALNINEPKNYLDNITGEDNGDFDETVTLTNGFLAGPVRGADGTVLANDHILVITREEIMTAIERRVGREVRRGLLNFYCGVDNFTENGFCVSTGGNRFFPRPALFGDGACLGNGNIATNCISGVANSTGRVPANPITPWTPVLSLLRGTTGSTPNWFQTNGWREHVYYAVANACIEGTADCNGVGMLTANHPPGVSSTQQRVVIVVAGKALSNTATPQARASTANKVDAKNYLEDENLLPLDDVFTYPPASPSTPFNDQVFTLP